MSTLLQKNIFIFGVKKKVKGRALWVKKLSVLCLIKKALSMVPKLSPWIVIINKNCTVIRYASGKKKSSFMQFIETINDEDTIIIEDKNRQTTTV